MTNALENQFATSPPLLSSLPLPHLALSVMVEMVPAELVATSHKWLVAGPLKYGYCD